VATTETLELNNCISHHEAVPVLMAASKKPFVTRFHKTQQVTLVEHVGQSFRQALHQHSCNDFMME
jgi:hypothetical protein